MGTRNQTLEQRLNEHDVGFRRLEATTGMNKNQLSAINLEIISIKNQLNQNSAQLSTQLAEVRASLQELKKNQAPTSYTTNAQHLHNNQQFCNQEVREQRYNFGGFNSFTKLEFPKFNGIFVEGWLYRVEYFFWVDLTPEHVKVQYAISHLEDIALQWHQVFVKSRGGSIEGIYWTEYKRFIASRFALDRNNTENNSSSDNEQILESPYPSQNTKEESAHQVFDEMPERIIDKMNVVMGKESNKNENSNKDDLSRFDICNEVHENDVLSDDMIVEVEVVNHGKESVSMNSFDIRDKNQEEIVLANIVYEKVQCNSRGNDNQIELGGNVGVFGLTKERCFEEWNKQIKWVDTGWFCNRKCKDDELKEAIISFGGSNIIGMIIMIRWIMELQLQEVQTKPPTMVFKFLEEIVIAFAHDKDITIRGYLILKRFNVSLIWFKKTTKEMQISCCSLDKLMCKADFQTCLSLSLSNAKGIDGISIGLLDISLCVAAISDGYPVVTTCSILGTKQVQIHETVGCIREINLTTVGDILKIGFSFELSIYQEPPDLLTTEEIEYAFKVFVRLLDRFESEIYTFELLTVEMFKWKQGWKYMLKMGFLFKATSVIENHATCVSKDQILIDQSGLKERKLIPNRSISSYNAFIVKVVEMVAEAVSLAEKMAAIGNPLTLRELVEAGLKGCGFSSSKFSNLEGCYDKKNIKNNEPILVISKSEFGLFPSFKVDLHIPQIISRTGNDGSTDFTGIFMLKCGKQMSRGPYFICGLLRTKVFKGIRLNIRDGDIAWHVMGSLYGYCGIWFIQYGNNSTKNFYSLSTKHDVELGFDGQVASFVFDTFD